MYPSYYATTCLWMTCLAIAGLSTGTVTHDAQWQEGIVKVCGVDLSQSKVRLSCGVESQSIHIQRAVIRKQMDINYASCTYNSEPYRLDTVTRHLVKECEGEPGNCTFDLDMFETFDNINYLGIQFDCIENSVVRSMCSSSTWTVPSATPLYLETEGFRSTGSSPFDLKCTCSMHLSSVGKVSLTTLYADLETGMNKCFYDYWRLDIGEDAKKGERRCGEITHSEEELQVAERLTLTFVFDHMNTKDQIFKGAWLKLSAESTMEVRCSQQLYEVSTGGWTAGSTWLAHFTSWLLTTPLLPLQSVDPSVKSSPSSTPPTITMSQSQSATESGRQEMTDSTSLFPPVTDDWLIPFIVVASMAGTLLLVFLGWVIWLYCKGSPRVGDENSTLSARHPYSSHETTLSISDSVKQLDSNNNCAPSNPEGTSISTTVGERTTPTHTNLAFNNLPVVGSSSRYTTSV